MEVVLLAPRHAMAPHTLAYETFRLIKPFGLLQAGGTLTVGFSRLQVCVTLIKPFGFGRGFAPAYLFTS